MPCTYQAVDDWARFPLASVACETIETIARSLLAIASASAAAFRQPVSVIRACLHGTPRIPGWANELVASRADVIIDDSTWAAVHLFTRASLRAVVARAVAGALIGAHSAMRWGSKYVRVVFLVIAGALIVRLLWGQFLA